MILPSLRHRQQHHHRQYINQPPWISYSKDTMDQHDQYLDPYDSNEQPLVSHTSALSHVNSYPAPMNQPDQNAFYGQFENPAFNQSISYPEQVQAYSTMPQTDFQDDGRQQQPETVNEIQMKKRREQNRKSQKEFRRRKEERIKELQVELANMQKSYRSVTQENGELKASRNELELEIERLVEENRHLRTSIESSPASEMGHHMTWMPPPNDDRGASSSSSMVLPPMINRSRRG